MTCFNCTYVSEPHDECPLVGGKVAYCAWEAGENLRRKALPLVWDNRVCLMRKYVGREKMKKEVKSNDKN